MTSTLQRTAWIVASVFMIIGIAGFVPSLTTQGDLALGIFEVNNLQNFIHLFTGVAAAFAAASSESAARRYFQIFGWIYALIAIVGFIQGNTFLGLFPLNTADTVLHTVTAGASLILGYGVRERVTTS